MLQLEPRQQQQLPAHVAAWIGLSEEEDYDLQGQHFVVWAARNGEGWLNVLFLQCRLLDCVADVRCANSLSYACHTQALQVLHVHNMLAASDLQAAAGIKQSTLPAQGIVTWAGSAVLLMMCKRGSQLKLSSAGCLAIACVQWPLASWRQACLYDALSAAIHRCVVGAGMRTKKAASGSCRCRDVGAMAPQQCVPAPLTSGLHCGSMTWKISYLPGVSAYYYLLLACGLPGFSAAQRLLLGLLAQAVLAEGGKALLWLCQAFNFGTTWARL
jgi:hypothetical protein